MKTYINFQPTALLIPYIKLYVTLLIIILTAGYYFSVNTQIQKNGFQIPDSLVETIIKVSPISNLQTQSESYLSGLPPILSNAATNYANNKIFQAVKKETQRAVDPYIAYLPPTLGILFFLSAISFAAILEILLYPLVFALFWVLTKSQFLKFKKEMREVKKLVI